MSSNNELGLDVTAKIGSVFVRGADGLVKPEFAPGMAWCGGETGLMTIKLDGEMHKVMPKGPNDWEIKRLTNKGSWQLLERLYDEDHAGLDAFAAMTEHQCSGYYVLYGKDINGNPHNLKESMMAKVFPVSHHLIIQKYVSKIRRGYGVSVGEFFEQIRAELLDSPDIEGLVFHMENHKMEPCRLGQVTRADFGYSWPARSWSESQQMPHVGKVGPVGLLPVSQLSPASPKVDSDISSVTAEPSAAGARQGGAPSTPSLNLQMVRVGTISPKLLN